MTGSLTSADCAEIFACETAIKIVGVLSRMCVVLGVVAAAMASSFALGHWVSWYFGTALGSAASLVLAWQSYVLSRDLLALTQDLSQHLRGVYEKRSY